MNHLPIDILITIQMGISCKWTNDSQRFLLEHLDIIHESPSHIYHSALPSSPSTTWLQECYGSELSQEIKMVKGLPAGWGTCSRTVSLGTTVYGISSFDNSVVIGSGHRDIIILDAITGSCKSTLLGHTDEVWCVAFSSDGRSLVSGSADKTIKLWDVQTGGAIRTFSGHTREVRSVSISVNCATIASGSFDKTVRLWDAQTGECYYTMEQQDEVFSIKFSPVDPYSFLFMSFHKIWQWHINGHQVGYMFEGTHADFSPDGTHIVSRYINIATVRNSSSGAVVATFPVVSDNGDCCRFSPDGRFIAVSTGAIAHVWDITSPEPHLIETFMGHADEIQYFAWTSPSSLISGSLDQSVKFWILGVQPTGLVETDPMPTSLTLVTTTSITLQTKDGIYITSDSDGVVKTFDIFTGLCKSSFQTPAKGTGKKDIRLIHGRLILAWHTDGEIKIWDVEKEDLLLTADGPQFLEDIKISEDGSRFFSKGARVIQAQSMQTGEIMGKAEIKFLPYDVGYFTISGSRVWVYYSAAETQVWDFRTPDLPPVQLPNMPLYITHPMGAILWDPDLFCVKEKATGKVIFQLPKRYRRPVNVQWKDQYLVVSFISGEVLVVDFSHVLPL